MLADLLVGTQYAVGSRWASVSACCGVFDPVSAACRASFRVLVTRWFSWVENSATLTCNWSRATAAAGTSCAYFFIFSVCRAAGVTAT